MIQYLLLRAGPTGQHIRTEANPENYNNYRNIFGIR